MTTVRKMREWPVGSVIRATPEPKNSRGRRGTTVMQSGVLLSRIRSNADVVPFYVEGQGIKHFNVARGGAQIISEPFYGQPSGPWTA